MSAMHKRKSSKEDPNDNPIVDHNNASTPPSISILAFPPSPPRSRVHSTSSSLPPLGPGIPTRNKAHVPPPLGVGIPARRPPSISLNSPPTSPYRTSFTAHNPNSHSRTRSISSGPFVPPISSPLSTSLPAHVPLHPFPFPSSSSTPEINGSDGDLPLPSGHPRRHSRLHSRNLSIFFPRPHATISEDERPGDEEAPALQRDPVLIPATQSESALGAGGQVGRELNAGFTFGGIPKSTSEPNGMRGSGPGVTTRRGHHHKHSLSHNFFSFLDPGKAQTLSVPTKGEELHSTPTETPISPWSPVSNASLFASPSMAAPELIPRSQSKSPGVSRSNSTSPAFSKLGVVPSENVSTSGMAAIITAFGQFALGALLWVRGQSIGSLACTGLGYWVVFDAIGVAGPAIVARQIKGEGKGMYGSARYGTSLLFAQCVYLMFAGVYVAKEAVEHMLLSAGGNAHGHRHGGGGGAIGGDGRDGHHHHWGDEKPENLGLRFPVLLILIVLISLICTSMAFGQHEVLVDITNKHISPLSLFRRGYQATPPPPEQRSGVKRISRNPYVLPPVLFCMAILGAEMVLDVAHYAPFDLALAALEVIVTTHVAYAACVVLGGVLLQTAPPMTAPGTMRRGVVPVAVSGPAARMEAFWRVVREIERHENVVHLPAPHVWQVVPAGQPRSITGPEAPASESESRNGHAHSNGHAHHGGHAHDHQHHDHTHDHAHNHHDHTHNHHDHAHDHHDHHSNDAPKHVLGGLQTTSPALIITLSPRVRSSLADADVLALTQWASERVLVAFGKEGKSGEVEVTVGVVRD